MADDQFAGLDDAVAGVLKDNTDAAATTLRNNLQFATGANPSAEAQITHLARYVGVPTETVRAQPDAIKTQAALQSIDTNHLAKYYPQTTQVLSNPDNMRMLHQDIPGTAAVEQSMTEWKPSIGQRVTEWLNDAFGVTAINKAKAENAVAAQRSGMTMSQARDAVGGMSELPEQFVGGALNTASFGIVPNVAGEAQTPMGQVGEGAGSLAGFLAPGGPAKAGEFLLGKVGLHGLERVATDSFAKALGKEVTKGAITLGAANVLANTGNALNTPDLVSAIKSEGQAGLSGLEMGGIFGAAGRLLPENTIAQTLARVLGVNTAMDLSQGTSPDDDRPIEKKVFDYGLNTFFALHGAGRTEGGWFHDAAKADIAQQDFPKFQAMSQVFAAAKFREHDPEQFKQFVSDIADKNNVPDVYVDAKTFAQVLDQAGVNAEELTKTMPAVAEQMREGLQSEGMVRIPIEDYATHIAGSEMDATLQPHLRTDPEGKTFAESKQFYQDQVDTLKQHVVDTLGEKANDDAWKKSSKQVEDNIRAQLDATGRMPPDVAKSNAALMRAFFETTAANEGVLPHEMLERYQLQARGDLAGGDRTLDQGAASLADVEKAWDAAGISHAISEKGNDISLSKIVVPEDARGQGIGTEALKKLTDYADATGKRILLTPPTDFGGTKSRLEKLYKSMGFVENAGGNKDFTTRERMIREPQATFDQSAKVKPGPDSPGAGLEEGNKLGFWPALRVKATGRLNLPEKAPILTGTNNKNAQRQIDAIDRILKKFPKATESTADWSRMMAHALGSAEVPIPPYAFIRDLNGTGSLDKLKTLTQGQIDDASHGFENAAEFRRAYTNGELGVETTGKLFMWSFLSRGVSPYTQESLFIDAFKGADKWISKAAAGDFTEADFPEYEAWAKSVAPKGSGQPGAGATHNLNAFGQNFLFRMGQKDADGISHLQRLHDMMCDPAMTGRKIRREFATFGEGVGIDNKVVSFTLLVAGHPDVMVLDRVQIRQLWDDGRFKGTNLYDGSSGPDGKKLAGSSLNSLAEGARGILVYEAIERGLEAKIQQMYADLGRPQDASIGRYHWETWVADSQQEASHGTLGAILEDAKGDDQAIANVAAKQGEYGAYEYGATYNRDAAGEPGFGYDTPTGGHYEFSVPAFRAFLGDIKTPATGVVPTKFKVTESGNGPWYKRTEVNQQRLDERARYWADKVGGSGEGQRALEQAVQDKAAADRAGAAGTAVAPGRPGVAGTFEQPARGQIAFGEDISKTPSVISLLKDADLSTFLHESGHFFLEVYSDLASKSGLDSRIAQDFQKALDWFGVKDADAWRAMSADEKRDFHEKFARGFEQYLMEGKAPTVELQSLFGRFRSWLLSVYKNLTGLNVELTPEVRGVMDRMLATDEAIKQSEAARGMKALFETKPDGMSEDAWTEYQKDSQGATEAAVSELQGKSIRDMQWMSNAKSKVMKGLQREAAGKRIEVRAEVTKEVDNQPIYQAERWLKKGEMTAPDGSEIKSEKGFRLNTDDLKTLFPEGMLGRPDMDRLKGMTSKEGLHPDIVAGMFGFDSGEKLVRELIDMQPKKDVIEGMTDQRMLERHGELIDQRSIERAAEAAIHNDVRARVLARELNALAKATGSPRLLAKAAAEAADAAINAKKVKDLQPKQYTIAEGKAGRASLEAFKKGDTQTAAIQKRGQLLNNALAKRAAEAQASIEKALQYLKKFDKASVRERLDGEFLAQIDKIRASVDLRKNPSGVNRATESLEKWADGLRDSGYEPQIADWLQELQTPTSYKELTVEQFTGLHDTVKSLEYIAREQKKVRVKGEMQDLQDVVGKLVERMDERGEKFTKADLLEPPKARVDGYWTALTHWLGVKMRIIGADLKPTEYKFNKYDIHEIDGPFRESILDPMLAANYRKVDLTKMVSDAAGKVGESLGKEWQESLYNLVKNDKLMDPDLGGLMKITRGRMLGIARHVGNESNFDKLTKGYKWESADVWQFLHDNMTAKDWQATQAHWDSFDPLWKETQAMIIRLGGVPPPKIPAREFDTKFGKVTGGYSPIDYDPLRSKLSVRKGEFDLGSTDRVGEMTAYKASTTSNGSLIARKQGYSDRVNLDFHSADARIRDTIHDLAYREALLDATKIMDSADFREKFMLTYGREEYAALADWLKSVRDQNVMDPRTRGFDKAMAYTRQGVVLTGIGYRVSTVLKHGGAAAFKSLGYLGTGEGAKYFAARLARMGTGHMMEDIRAAQEKFPEIRARMLQMDRDFSSGTASMYEAESWKEKNDRFGHAMVAWSDALSAVPTAWAAYDLAKTSGVPESMGGTGQPMSEEAAVSYANSVVRQAHGSALEVTRSNFMQSRGAKGFFGALYGFMNNTYGQTADMLDKSISGGYFKNNPAVAARLLATLIVPALWTQWLKDSGPGSEESTFTWAAKAITGEVAAMVPFVRDAVSLLESGRSSTVAPTQMVTDAVNSGKDIWHEAQGQQTRLIQDLSNAIGEWAHIAGLGQLGHILQYMRDTATGKKHADSTAMEVKEAVIGGKPSK